MRFCIDIYKTHIHMYIILYIYIINPTRSMSIFIGESGSSLFIASWSCLRFVTTPCDVRLTRITNTNSSHAGQITHRIHEHLFLDTNHMCFIHRNLMEQVASADLSNLLQFDAHSTRPNSSTLTVLG